jgi:hypothetical protein
VTNPRNDPDFAGSEKADGTQPPSTPGWVKAFAVVAGLVLVILVLVMLLTGGQHGPGRHL